MYKCSECGLEYEIKPDYCDCGNDVFSEIVSEKKSEIKHEKSEILKENSILRKNLPSIIFLVICIIISFIILFFVGNPKSEPEKTIKKEQTIKKDIPDIDKLWNDEKPKQIVQQQNPPKMELQKQPTEPKIAKVELKKEPQIIAKPVIKKPSQVQTKTQVKSSQVQQSKPVQTKTQVKSSQVQQSKPVQTKQTVTQVAKKPSGQIQTSQPVQQVPQQQVTQQKPATVASSIQTSNPIKQTQTNSEELKQYKKALRNKIASYIDFLDIAGDGKCVLSFSISSSGALLNRKFVSQSQNTSLNDAVYAAMLKVPSFKTPPSGYSGETMKLTVKISGGNFEVSLE